MKQNLKQYFYDFDTKYKTLEFIDNVFHEKELGVVSYASKANTKDTKGDLSEEYIRTRFVYALVNSGYFQKELLCIEFSIPKGNKAKSIKPDIVAFKNKDWVADYKYGKEKKDFKKIRQNLLVIFETKKNNKDVEEAVENQLRSAMAENESKERVFGVYFDDKPDILIFKKFGNSPINRFDETFQSEIQGEGNWNLGKRDSLSDFPTFQDFQTNNKSIKDPSKLTTEALDAIDESTFKELIIELKRIADRERPNHSERDLIVEFLTLKVFDEKRSKRDKGNLKFYIADTEKKQGGLGTESFRERISTLYKDAQKEYKNVLSKAYFSYDSSLKPSNANEERFLIAIIENVQKRAILKAKNESFNQIIFNNFGDDKQKADKGQFFTPIHVVKAIIQLLNPVQGEELCDPCCGICDFPAMAFRYAHRGEDEYPANADNYFGFDIDKNNLKLAELNLVLNGDGGAVLKTMNSLSQKLLQDGSTLKIENFTTENYHFHNWANKEDSDKDPRKFKIIATNPPFGKGRDLKTGAKGKWDINPNTINLYETYRVKPTPNSKGEITLPKSMDMGVLFLENAYKLLEDGGRMGIVLSNSIASIKEWENVRAWLIEKVRIVGLFDLPANTFGETGVATTVIIAYKPKANEKHLMEADYEVFIKEIENTGYEVKTVLRAIVFQPQYIINEETFKRTDFLLEDFTEMQNEFNEFLKRQEIEIKKAFNFEIN